MDAENERVRTLVKLVRDLAGVDLVSVQDLLRYRPRDVAQGAALRDTDMSKWAEQLPKELLGGFDDLRGINVKVDKWLPLHVAILFLGKFKDLTWDEKVYASRVLLLGGAFDGVTDTWSSVSDSDDAHPPEEDEEEKEGPLQEPPTVKGPGVRGVAVGSAQADPSVVHARGSMLWNELRRAHAPAAAGGALVASQCDENT
jgi:hypothetical protein